MLVTLDRSYCLCLSVFIYLLCVYLSFCTFLCYLLLSVCCFYGPCRLSQNKWWWWWIVGQSNRKYKYGKHLAYKMQKSTENVAYSPKFRTLWGNRGRRIERGAITCQHIVCSQCADNNICCFINLVLQMMVIGRTAKWLLRHSVQRCVKSLCVVWTCLNTSTLTLRSTRRCC